MKASDYIAKYLEMRGVTHVFELVGGMITLLLDSLQRNTRISIISMHHEQGAGFAAEGYGRFRGSPGIAMATSGPGATNLLTAIGSCYFDSVPTIFITGQVNRSEQKGDRKIRQLGFQETDIVSMAKPITKAAWLVNDPMELPDLLEKAFALATHGRPGPVLLDIPMDVQKSDLANVALSRHFQQHPGASPESDQLYDFLQRLQKQIDISKRPLILAGGGINCAQAVQEFRALVERIGIPVVNSLLAVDALPHGDPKRVGLIGSYGNRWANIALSECDFLLVVGSRLDVRQTGADTDSFKQNRSIYHIDCESGELNNRVTGCHTYVGELKMFLNLAASSLQPGPSNPEWVSRISFFKASWPDIKELTNLEGINPNAFFHTLSGYLKSASAYVVDVGQHQMWAAQSLEVNSHQRFMTSGGMGAMGFALPAGIGVALASKKQVAVIAGDGGFQLNIQELQTVIRNKLPIKIIVINNQSHGMVRQFQETYFQGRLQSTVWGYSSPSFVDIAKAYGIRAWLVENEDQLESALEMFCEHPSEPCLLEVKVSINANAYPKMAFGKPISEMEPFSRPLAMEAT